MNDSNLEKSAQTSLFDFLLDSIPELQFIRNKKNGPSSVERSLYSLWSDAENQINSRKFQKPIGMDDAVVMQLESSGLVEVHNKNIKVTNKGANAIQKIILNEETSIFEKSASQNGIVKVASIQNNISRDTWYQRIRN